MPVNFVDVDEHIFNQNSIYFPGTTANTALKVTACTTVLIGLVSSCIIANGFPLNSIGGTALLLETVVLSAGGTLWYRHRVNSIQEAAKTLIDRVQQNAQEKELSRYLENGIKMDWSNVSPTCFFDVEFLQRFETLLEDQECFPADQLRSLLNSHYFYSDYEKYTFLANQILKLDDEAKNSVFAQDSPDAQGLIIDMMIGICHYSADTFDAFYKLIPDSTRKKVLLELGKVSLENSYNTKLLIDKTRPFVRALKQAEKHLIKEINDEKFENALSKAYSQEFMQVEDIEASTRFLVELYPLLEPSQIPLAFSIDASKVNHLGLELWIKVVHETGTTVVDSIDFVATLIQKPGGKLSFFDCLKQNWNTLKEDIEVICQNKKTPTIFGLFAHLLNSELSGSEKAFVQQMKFEEIEKYFELAPQFLQIWLENKEIPQLCLEYIQKNKPDKIRSFFKALSVEQLFVWLQSPERDRIDFTKKGLEEICYCSRDLNRRKERLQTKSNWSVNREEARAAQLGRKIAIIEVCLEHMEEVGYEQLNFFTDVFIVWQGIISLDNFSEKVEWWWKLFNLLGRSNYSKCIISYAQGMKSENYIGEIKKKIVKATPVKT